ncbi:hypothetical protein Rsub_10802 [Raphidocelis subcapitata]|uniref:Uncharacterized protein n=1 Tax=Raphidocelis subcapitata TaxID=307507 RepID=A0A2V0PKS4_9CHLO|nr:hypothetical protein Rsub_10802 [Raphidocelis subcapitata]|eukprot:GBF98613.1 hypothetical protein Rsub_10802 [Raphidocelis subcapitata]
METAACAPLLLLLLLLAGGATAAPAAPAPKAPAPTAPPPKAPADAPPQRGAPLPWGASAAPAAAPPSAWGWRAAAALAANGSLPEAGTSLELWRWWTGPAGARGPPEGARPAFGCLANAFASRLHDRRIYDSPAGEDGILETLLGCLGARRGVFVDLEPGAGCGGCGTRLLRFRGWTGFRIGGDSAAPHAVAGAMRRRGVPHPGFDHLNVGLGVSTFHVLRACLAAGNRPRSIAVAYNRNFAPHLSYAALSVPSEAGRAPSSCYFSASALALQRLLLAFSYSPVAFGADGGTLFFVADEELGAPLPAAHDLGRLTRQPRLEAWAPLGGGCAFATWLRIGEGSRLAGRGWLALARTAVLSERPEGLPPLRAFDEASPSPAVALAHEHSRGPRDGGGLLGAAFGRGG